MMSTLRMVSGMNVMTKWPAIGRIPAMRLMVVRIWMTMWGNGDDAEEYEDEGGDDNVKE